MAKAKPRQVRMEQRGSLEAMQRLEHRTDEELQRETRHKSAAMALLGARAAERYDAKAAREYFRQSIAVARPQERLQLRRMADASLALAERRADDLKASMERLGQTPPTNRQLLGLKAMGLLAPSGNSGLWPKVRAGLLILLLVIALLAVGLGIVELVALPFGGVSVAGGVLLGLVVVAAALGVLALFGRRRQAKARESRAAETASAAAGRPGKRARR
jgi:uncharacterized integral membrane protein